MKNNLTEGGPTMEPYTIRRKTKFGMFTVHNRDGQIWAEVDENLFFWSPEATTAFVGAIEHGGNFLDGTEYRRNAVGLGDWVQYPHLEYGHVVSTAALHHGSNFYPSMEQVVRALQLLDTDGWETTNPADGHNGEWVPLNQYIVIA